MLPGEVKRAGSPVLNPFESIGTARFLAEVVAKISGRNQYHVGCGLRTYVTAYHSARDGAQQEPATDGQPVGNGGGSLMELRIGCYRLRIEVVQPLILPRMWREMEAASQRLIGRKDGIELGERVECRRGS